MSYYDNATVTIGAGLKQLNREGGNRYALVNAPDVQVDDSGTRLDTAFSGIKNNIAPQYSTTSTYAIGDYVIYGNKLYKCNTTINSGEAWNANHWNITNIGDEIKDDASIDDIDYLKGALNEFLVYSGGKNKELCINNCKSVLWMYFAFENDSVEASFWNGPHTYEDVTTTSRNIGLSAILTAGTMDFYWFNDDITYISYDRAFRLTKTDESVIFANGDTILYEKDLTLDGFSTTLYILVDWSKTTVNSSLVYNAYYDKAFIGRAKCIYELFQYYTNKNKEFIELLATQEANIDKIISDNYVVGNALSYTSYEGYFFGSDGLFRRGTSTPFPYVIDMYPVSEGDIVSWDVKNWLYSTSWSTCVIGFSTNTLVEGEYVEPILFNEQAEADYQGSYLVKEDGYIYTASNLQQKQKMILYSAQTIKNALELDYYPENIKNADNVYTGYNIYRDGTIASAEDSELKIYKYSVSKDMKYLLYSESYKLNTNYAIASFSESDFSNGLSTLPILIEKDKNKYDTYQVLFIAPEDGYVYIANASNDSKTMYFAEAKYNSAVNINDIKYLKNALKGSFIYSGGENAELCINNCKSILWMYFAFENGSTELSFWNGSHTYNDITTSSRNIGFNGVLTGGTIDFYWYKDDKTYIDGDKAFTLNKTDASAIFTNGDTILYKKNLVLDGFSTSLYILIDWSKTIVNSTLLYNAYYDKALIEKAKRIYELFEYYSYKNEEFVRLLEAKEENIARLLAVEEEYTDRIISDNYVADDALSYTTYNGYFFNASGLFRVDSTLSYYVVDMYPVSKGDIVSWNVKNWMYSPSWSTCIIGFSTNTPVVGEYVKPILLNKQVAADYQGNYLVKENGYIYTASNLQQSQRMILYHAQTIKDALEFEYYPGKEKNIDSVYSKYYFNKNNIVTPIGESRFKIYKYAVSKNMKYLLYSESYKINANYAIAGFSESDFSEGLSILPILTETNKDDYNSYRVLFVAPENGYVYVANASNDSKPMYFAEAKYGVDDSPKETIKIQLFGDSITDNSWRADKTQWSTLFMNYIPQYRFDIINSAIGSTRIGHGYKEQNRKYTDLSYNYCHDLITNSSVLRTDNDIVILFVGTNDWHAATNLGALGDSTTDTFYGSIKLICEYLQTNTESLFMVCTPIGRNYIDTSGSSRSDDTRSKNEYGVPLNDNNLTLRDYCDALVETCHLYGVPVIDLNYDLGWSKYNVNKFTQDGLHPVPAGSEKIAKLMASRIKEYLGL